MKKILKRQKKNETKSSNKMPPIKRSFKFMPQPLPYIQTKPLNITTLNVKKKKTTEETNSLRKVKINNTSLDSS